MLIILYIVLFFDYGIMLCVVVDLYVCCCGCFEFCREWGYFYKYCLWSGGLFYFFIFGLLDGVDVYLVYKIIFFLLDVVSFVYVFVVCGLILVYCWLYYG